MSGISAGLACENAIRDTGLDGVADERQTMVEIHEAGRDRPTDGSRDHVDYQIVHSFPTPVKRGDRYIVTRSAATSFVIRRGRHLTRTIASIAETRSRPCVSLVVKIDPVSAPNDGLTYLPSPMMLLPLIRHLCTPWCLPG